MVGKNTASVTGVYTRYMLQHNRITIPKPLVEELNLQYTNKVDITHLDDGSINIKPSQINSTPLVKKVHRSKQKLKTKAVVKPSLLKNKKLKKLRKSLKQVLAIQ